MGRDVTIAIKAKDMASGVFARINGNVSKMASKIRTSSAGTIGAAKNIGGSFKNIASRAAGMATSVVGALASVITKMAKFAAVGAAIAGATFVAIISKASDMEETMGKFGVVFGNSASSVEKWSNRMADKLGVSRMEMAGMMAGLQDLLVPMGVAPDAALGMSKTLSKLAVDLGSFNNMPTAKVQEDLMAALTGSGEVMKKYGVVLTEANVKQELFNMGLNPKNVTDAQKAQARMNIIMRGTTAAQGDAERTAGSFANQIKRLKANIVNIATAIGGPMLSALSGVAQTINEKVSGAFEFIQSRSGVLQSFAQSIAGVLSSAVSMISGFIQRAVFFVRSHMDIVMGFGQVLAVAWNAAKAVVGTALGAIVGLLGKGISKAGGFREMMQTAIRGIITAITFLETTLINLPLLFETAKNSSALQMLTLGLDIGHIFTKVLPNKFQIFRVFVSNVFRVIVRETVGLFQSMIQTVIGLLDRVASLDPTGIVQVHIAALKKGSEFLGAMQDNLNPNELPKAVGPRQRTSAEDDLAGKIQSGANKFAADFAGRLGPRLANLDKAFADQDKKTAVGFAKDLFTQAKDFVGGFFPGSEGGIPGGFTTEPAADAIAKAAPALKATEARLLTSAGGGRNPVLDESKKQTQALNRIADNTTDNTIKGPDTTTQLQVVG